ncbi:MAG: peptidoglycan-binding protein [Clostridia bacterium]|nr:peptidoglycan-binding protein [Clostridia bacterium]
MSRKREDVRLALDAALSGVDRDPALFNRVVNASKGELPPVKRKLTFSMALVLILVLITGTVAVAAAYRGVSYFLTEKSEKPTDINEDYLVSGLESYHNSTLLNAEVVDAYWDGVNCFIAYRVSPADPSLTLRMQCMNLYHGHDQGTENADLWVQEPSFIMLTDRNGDVTHAEQLADTASSYDWVYEEDGSITVLVKFPLYGLEDIETISVPVFCGEAGKAQVQEAYLHFDPPALADPVATHEHQWTETTGIGPKVCAICGRTEGGARQHHNSKLLSAEVTNVAWDGATFTLDYCIRPADPALTLQMQCTDPAHEHTAKAADLLVQEPGYIMLTDTQGKVTHIRADGFPLLSCDWTYAEDGSIVVHAQFPLNSAAEIESYSIPIFNAVAGEEKLNYSFLHFYADDMLDPIPPHDHAWAEATCVSARTCTICQRTEGGLGDHDFRPAADGKTTVCSVCETVTNRTDCEPLYMILQPGDYTNYVWEMQYRLCELGFYDGQLSARYDQATQAAVKAFQESQGLEADGICDIKTLEKLFP